MIEHKMVTRLWVLSVLFGIGFSSTPLQYVGRDIKHQPLYADRIVVPETHMVNQGYSLENLIKSQKHYTTDSDHPILHPHSSKWEQSQRQNPHDSRRNIKADVAEFSPSSNVYPIFYTGRVRNAQQNSWFDDDKTKNIPVRKITHENHINSIDWSKDIDLTDSTTPGYFPIENVNVIGKYSQNNTGDQQTLSNEFRAQLPFDDAIYFNGHITNNRASHPLVGNQNYIDSKSEISFTNGYKGETKLNSFTNPYLQSINTFGKIPITVGRPVGNAYLDNVDGKLVPCSENTHRIASNTPIVERVNKNEGLKLDSHHREDTSYSGYNTLFIANQHPIPKVEERVQDMDKSTSKLFCKIIINGIEHYQLCNTDTFSSLFDTTGGKHFPEEKEPYFTYPKQRRHNDFHIEAIANPGVNQETEASISRTLAGIITKHNLDDSLKFVTTETASAKRDQNLPINTETGEGSEISNAFIVYIPDRVQVPVQEIPNQHDVYFNLTEISPGVVLVQKRVPKPTPDVIAYAPAGILTSSGLFSLLSVIRPEKSTPPGHGSTETRKDNLDLYVPTSEIITDIYRDQWNRKFRLVRNKRRISSKDMDAFIREIDQVTSVNKQPSNHQIETENRSHKKEMSIKSWLKKYIPIFEKQVTPRDFNHHSVQHAQSSFVPNHDYRKRNKRQMALKTQNDNHLNDDRNISSTHFLLPDSPTTAHTPYNSQVTDEGQLPSSEALDRSSQYTELPSSYQSESSSPVLPDLRNSSASLPNESYGSNQISTEYYKVNNTHPHESQAESYYEYGIPNNGNQSSTSIKQDQFVLLTTNNSVTNDLTDDSYLNQMVDIIIDLTNKELAIQGKSIITIPDVDQEFEDNILGIMVTGEFHGRNGWFKNTSTLHRITDIVLSRSGVDTLTVQFSFALSEIEIGFDHIEASFAGIYDEGKLTGVVESNVMSLQLSITINSHNRCNVTLDDFKLTELGYIDVYISGLGALNWLVSKIGSRVINGYKGEIIDKVHQEILIHANAALSQLKC